MGNENQIELEAFLPKYTPAAENDNSDICANSESSSADAELVRRTKVHFYTRLPSGSVSSKHAVYVFGKNLTIEEAAHRAVASYPELEIMPDFSKVCVFYSNNTLIPELNVSVHSMFGPDDTMTITNSPFIHEEEMKKGIRALVIFFVTLLIILFGLIAILAYFDV